MAITIRKVIGKKDKKEFIRLPYRIYRGKNGAGTAWVPPLDIDVLHIMDTSKAHLYDHAEGVFWLAEEDGQVVGRIAAFVDHNYIKFHKTQTGFFGFFESFNRQDVAKTLFACAEKWLNEKKMEWCIGPINGSTNYQLGNQIDSFDLLPVIEMPYAAPFYGELIENSGYAKMRDLYSYKRDIRRDYVNDKISKVAAIASKRNNIRIRCINMKDWDNEVKAVKDIWDSAWRNNWGFVPWYDPEFYELAKNLKMIVNPKLAYIAEMQGRKVGFCFPIPDINFAFRKLNGKLLPFGVFRLLAAKKKAKQLRIAAFGVLQEYQNKGVDAAMMVKLADDGLAEGFDIGEFSWILETNYPLRNLLEKWGCECYRTHRVYCKQIS